MEAVVNGKKYKFFVKERFIENKKVGALKAAKEQLIIARSAEDVVQTQKEIQWSSVLNELIINRRATSLYQERFGEPLPIEQPVGFVVDREGRKWAIFEFIENIIYPTQWPRELQQRASDFAHLLADRLPQIGIQPEDMDKLNTIIPIRENIIEVGDLIKPNEIKIMVIDSELWRTTPNRNQKQEN